MGIVKRKCGGVNRKGKERIEDKKGKQFKDLFRVERKEDVKNEIYGV